MKKPDEVVIGIEEYVKELNADVKKISKNPLLRQNSETGRTFRDTVRCYAVVINRLEKILGN